MTDAFTSLRREHAYSSLEIRVRVASRPHAYRRHSSAVRRRRGGSFSLISAVLRVLPETSATDVEFEPYQQRKPSFQEIELGDLEKEQCSR